MPFFVCEKGGCILKRRCQDIKEWFPIKTYKNNQIFLKNGKSVYLYQVTPSSFHLKSSREQEIILEAYQNCIKTCDVDMEIVIQTDRINIKPHFQMLLAFSKTEPYFEEMIEEYIRFVQELTKAKESISRKFYLVIDGKQKSKEEKLIACFNDVGNTVIACDEDEVKQVLQRSFQKASVMRKEARWV